jgi:hypothetical protein
MSQSPFNQLDSLILTQLPYLDWSEALKGKPVTLAEACDSIKTNDSISQVEAERYELALRAGDSLRFRDIRIIDYTAILSQKKELQFCAMFFQLPDRTYYIAYEGTEHNLIGWKENFNMTYMCPTAGQKAALDYLNRRMSPLRSFHLGGHSKGGNLAVYSAVFCNPKIQKKINKIYNFDGPGFNRKMINDEAYQRIEKRIETFVPRQSIVGLLMEHQETYKVVENKEFALLQHEGFSWIIDRDGFVLVDEVNKYSRSLSRTLKAWLDEMNPAERKEVVDAFFDVFVRAEIDDFRELVSLDVKKTARLIKEVAKVPHEQRDKVTKLIKLFIEEHTKK